MTSTLGNILKLTGLGIFAIVAICFTFFVANCLVNVGLGLVSVPVVIGGIALVMNVIVDTTEGEDE